MTNQYKNGISVAMATFNGGQYLRQQLDSVLAQSLLPLEIVISDDGSTDGTLEILDEYESKYELVRVIKNQSSGINSNFVNAVLNTRGTWVAFCDQDDIWDADKLEFLHSKSQFAQIVYSRSRLIDSQGQPLPVLPESYLGIGEYQSGDVCPLYFFNSNCISGHAMMIRRDTVDKSLPIPDGMLFDQWFALVASCKGRIEFVDRALTNHRIHATNSNNNQSRRAKQKLGQNKRSKSVRFFSKREKSLYILRRIKRFESDLSNHDRYIIGKYTSHIQSSANMLIDLPFFIEMIRVRERLFSHKPIKKIFQESLGGSYYKLLDSLLSRH